jgi:putative flippase GtrA
LKLNKLLSQQLLRYAIAGFTNNGIAYIIYIGLAALLESPKIAMSMTYFGGMVVGFFLNRSWVFKNQNAQSGIAWTEVIKYLMAHAGGYGLNYLILHYFVDVLGYPHPIVQAASILIVAAFLFTVFRYFVFSTKPK